MIQMKAARCFILTQLTSSLILCCFRLCHKIDHNSIIDVTVFFYDVAHYFANVVLSNNINKTRLVRCVFLVEYRFPVYITYNNRRI